MDRFSWLAWGVGISVILVQPVALAKTAVQINDVAQAITVKISASTSSGSGILLQRQGDVYTVLTVAHVVKDLGANFAITAPDGKVYKPIGGSIRRYKGDVDLAVLKFSSVGTYKLAELGNSNQLKGGMDLYVAGFPAPTQVITQSVFVFRRGQVTANSKKVFKNGYALLYDNDTLPGMSGGPILDVEGKVVGVHGKGDREEESRAKTGFNSGIPIARFADLAESLGINLGTTVARTRQNPSLVADDYLVSANQKDDQGNYRGALADYSKVIVLNPKSSKAYYNRGLLQFRRLKDPQGALADLNQAISINPKYAEVYELRGMIKITLQKYPSQDYRGAIADFNQAISLKSTLAGAHHLRGLLRYEILNDQAGGITDVRKAIKLARAQGNSRSLQLSLEVLQRWKIEE
jgi:S1-C subfamily serine protease